jgi:hypothetical protein
VIGADDAKVKFMNADKSNDGKLSKEEVRLASKDLLGGGFSDHGHNLQTWCDEDMLEQVFKRDGRGGNDMRTLSHENPVSTHAIGQLPVMRMDLL